MARVVADPARVPEAAMPGGWRGLIYYRLHGSPRTYFSPYPAEYLDTLAHRLDEQARDNVPVWCIFDKYSEWRRGR
ncbi:MAG: hypothetical protein ACR2OG_01455 [Gemmatimonadaceae bacterium]